MSWCFGLHHYHEVTFRAQARYGGCKEFREVELIRATCCWCGKVVIGRYGYDGFERAAEIKPSVR